MVKTKKQKTDGEKILGWIGALLVMAVSVPAVILAGATHDSKAKKHLVNDSARAVHKFVD